MDLELAATRLKTHAGLMVGGTSPGIAARLRPFVGIRDADLADLIHAAMVMHGDIVSSEHVNRRVVTSLWYVCFELRSILSQSSPIQRNKLISLDDAAKLTIWVNAIELCFVRMLLGTQLHYCITPIAEVIRQRIAAEPSYFRFLIPELKSMTASDDDDVVEIGVAALAVLETA
jgi:hypothetical protein